MPFTINTYRNLSYGTQPWQIYDAAWPQATGKYNGLITIHGGGWYAGDKEDIWVEAQEYAKTGLVVMNINWRLVAGIGAPTTWPGVLDDITAAINQIRTFSCVNLDKIYLCGYSAGGNIALLHALLRGGHKGVISIAGETDMVQCDTYDWVLPWGNNPTLIQAVETFAGGNSQAQLQAVSPKHVTVTANPVPRILLYHEIGDVLLPVEQLDLFYQAKLSQFPQMSINRVVGWGHAQVAANQELQRKIITDFALEKGVQ